MLIVTMVILSIMFITKASYEMYVHYFKKVKTVQFPSRREMQRKLRLSLGREEANSLMREYGVISAYKKMVG